MGPARREEIFRQVSEHLEVEVVQRVFAVEENIDSAEPKLTVLADKNPSKRYALFSGFDVLVKHISPLRSPSCSISWGIHKDELPRFCPHPKKVEFTRSSLVRE